MKKRIRYAVISMGLIFMLMISGCLRTYTHEKVEMVTQIFHAIPDSDNHDLNSLNYEVIETDKYGRRLFAFTTSNMSGYCILQKTDESYAYYYDNVSFQLERKRLSVLVDEYDPEDLEELKIQNDWDKELDESKMVKKLFVKATELVRRRESKFDRETVNELMKNALEEKNDRECFSSFCDYSQTGQELFFINYYGTYGKYLLIINADGTVDPDNGFMKIDDWDKINEMLAEIKENNGWVG